MLLRQETLQGLAEGTVTLAFRRWKRPTVKAGGTLLTSIGQLSIGAVDVVDLEEIDEDGARAAGFDDLATLRAELLKRREGSVYRIALRLAYATRPGQKVAVGRNLPILGRLSGLAPSALDPALAPRSSY